MSIAPVNPIPYAVLFLVFFTMLSITAQIAAYLFGTNLNSGNILTNFSAAGCIAIMIFIGRTKRTPTNWEARQLTLACVLMFSVFEMVVGFILLNTDDGGKLVRALAAGNPFVISGMIFMIVFMLYGLLFAIFFWGARAYERFFVLANLFMRETPPA